MINDKHTCLVLEPLRERDLFLLQQSFPLLRLQVGECVVCESVVYWYSFSNPRTKCIHYDNCLVIKKKHVLSFPAP